MITPTLERAKELLKGTDFKVIPVMRSIPSDSTTPIEVMRILKNVSRHCFLLESVEDSKQWGRYTFLGYDPVLELNCIDHNLTIKSGMTINETVDHPGAYIRKVLAENKSIRLPEMPSFTGGLVGYFSYDYIKYAEPTLVLNAQDEEQFKDVDLMLFDKVIAFDNLKQQIDIIINVKTNDLEMGYNRAEKEIGDIARLILRGKKADIKPLKLLSDFEPLFNEQEYCEMVEKGKNYIHEGDIFQVVLSNRLMAKMEGSLFDTYRKLRMVNPSPYMFYFSSDDVEIAGASPETLVKLEDGVLHTFPLAGTRPRGKTKDEDLALEADLLKDEKELAEHNMLVDLGRNDIGKISEIGSVRVEKYMEIERYSHVMHIGSTVCGNIRPNMDAVDAIDSILPAGTLSGAPKLRACEIINELEDNKRGIYGGAVGYIDLTGNLDVCIAIRLAFAKNGKIFVRSGAGIVADSVPENEYRECINKAAAVVKSVNEAEGGLDNDITD